MQTVLITDLHWLRTNCINWVVFRIDYIDLLCINTLPIEMYACHMVSSEQHIHLDIIQTLFCFACIFTFSNVSIHRLALNLTAIFKFNREKKKKVELIEILLFDMNTISWFETNLCFFFLSLQVCMPIHTWVFNLWIFFAFDSRRLNTSIAFSPSISSWIC